ncbi:MAG: TIGR03013 family XrtA/PEP-CTERM system glycosyltransferase [Cellulophaga sp.]
MKLFIIMGDIFIIILSINLAFIIRMKESTINYIGLTKGIVIILLMLASYLISFYIFDFYNTREKFRGIRFLANVIGSLILVSIISIGFFYAFPFMLGRGVFLISLILIGILTAIWRLFYSLLFGLNFPTKRVLIVGKGKPAEAVYSLIKKIPEYKVIDFIADTSKKKGLLEKKILENPISLEKIINDYNIDDIVVTESIRSKKLNKILVNCKMSGINIWDIPTFYEHFVDKLPVHYIKENWFLFNDGFDKLGSNIHRRLKRAIDLLISIAFLIIAFPIGIIISIAIALNSKGPVFYIQERVGENEKLFNLFKFRTMLLDAEKGNPVWAEENDSRKTSIGKILRKTRMDELPQIINIIKGNMSLIGPRPEREFFVKILTENIPFYSLRFSVKPGLTGWAQVIYKYGASEKDALEKLQYELYYIKNMSLFLDLKILLKTIRIVLFGMGR